MMLWRHRDEAAAAAAARLTTVALPCPALVCTHVASVFNSIQFNQSINQSINPSINQSINQSFICSGNKGKQASHKGCSPTTKVPAKLRRIHQVRRFVGQDVAQQLVSAFILSRLDYCNSLLSHLSGSSFSLCSVWWMQQLELSWTCHIAWPCENSVEAATLTASWAKKYIQELSVHAPHPHQRSTTTPVRLCILSFCSQWQIPAEVDWLSG